MDNLVNSIKEEIEPLIDNLESSLEEINELTIEITEIPAPPFKEEKRAEFIHSYFKQIGYDSIIDEVGNVLAFKDELPPQPVILSAHLDTVFENTEIDVKIDGDILRAPGIGDDSRGLANLLKIAELLFDSSFSDSILFVATVGEEGRGDLRGVKHLFSDRYEFNTQAFITIDGTSTSRIINQAMGSLRYRLHIKGPGGHSYGSFGTVNPLYALGSFMEQFSRMKHKDGFISTHSLGVVGGGTSINAIPEEVWVDIDLRSEKSSGLSFMADQVRKFVENAISSENESRKGDVEFDLEEVGDRPAGMLKDEIFEKLIRSVHHSLDLDLEFKASSTDANIPLSQSIPAISVAGVEKSANAHRQDEWIDASDASLVPIKRNLLLLCVASRYYSQ